MIIVEPQGGLGNRLRVLDSAIQLSVSTNKMLYVIWNLNSEFNCRLEHLFEIPDKIYEIIYSASRFSSLKKRILIWRCGKKFFQNDIVEDKSFGKNIENLVSTQSIYIRTCSNFYGDKMSFCWVRPAKAVLDKIDKIVKKFDENIIGVHIRRKDNIKSREVSTTGNFLDLMQKIINKNNKVRFFLATDDINEELIMKKVYGERILVYSPKVIERDNPDAAADAFIDLMCLAATTKIIGSYWSSFTDVASAIGKNELIIAK